MKKKKYTREELLNICERAFVPEDKWSDRDSADAQKQLGWCYAWLKAGCEFEVLYKEGGMFTDERTIWIEVKAKGFMYFEDSECGKDEETFYLPTEAKLEKMKGRDWY